MRKKIITACILITICLSSFSQTTEIALRATVDSLKKIEPSLKGKARIDCMNTIVDIINILDDVAETQIAEGCFYSELAYNEAQKIEYKRGLGYALLKMCYCNGLKADIQIRNNQKIGTGYFTIFEQQITQAMNIAKELGDNAMMGEAYFVSSYIEKLKNNPAQHINFLKNAIIYYEKPTNQPSPGVYQGVRNPNCKECNGNEYRLAGLYFGLGILYKDPVMITELMNKAIAYYQKVGAISDIAFAFMQLGNTVSRRTNAETGVEYYKMAIPYYQKVLNENGEFNAYIALCTSYFDIGDFENGLEYSKKCVLMAERLAKKYTRDNGVNSQLHQAYFWVGKFYSIANDYETAFAFMRKARSYSPDNRLLVIWASTMAEFHRVNGNYDSAMYYINNPGNRRNGVLISLSSLHISMHQYDSALLLVNNITKFVIENNNLINLGRLYTNAAKAYYGKKEYANALTNARTSFALTKKTSRNLLLIDNCQLLSDIFNKLGKSDSAYFYLKHYTFLKDSIINRQFYKRLNEYKKETEDLKRIGQIKLLQKDNLIKEQQLQQQILLKEQSEAQLTLLDKNNEIKDQQLLIKDQSLKEQTLLKDQKQSQLTLSDKENKLKDQRLKQQTTIRNALLGGLLLFILLGVFVFRVFSLKRKNEKLSIKKEQAELQQKVSELEMQALRAQMNPHFIFNCLNSINRFIFKNETNVASDYLTRFSRLIRMVLLHSQKKLVPLEDELEMLKLYLDMERLRFKDAFDYHITTTNAIENSSVFIPPLLLQPFCENAIWHGLMHKDGQGHLNVQLNEEGGVLYCTITDNGVGREKAEEFKSKSAEKEKSMGLKITKERLSLLNQGTTGGTFYKIEDLINEQGEIAGTKVNLQIKYKQSIEEFA